jgi:hypothetical protein
VEVHSESPPIVQIYDLISDKTISYIQSLASPSLRRARILGTPENPSQKSHVRTSAVTWITEDAARLEFIPEIIFEATGLNAVTGVAAEDLQVSNYGPIGGHYDSHLDSLFDELVRSGNDFNQVNSAV